MKQWSPADPSLPPPLLLSPPPEAERLTTKQSVSMMARPVQFSLSPLVWYHDLLALALGIMSTSSTLKCHPKTLKVNYRLTFQPQMALILA